MKKAVIVIGCSYGDEGKGLAAVSAVRDMASPCLNVLINGGPQRGHTVDLPDGRRHIFRHFGSGALAGAVSCADEDYMVNPLLFMDEWTELREKFSLEPVLLASSLCRVTLPWDMMLGQIIEESRGRARHGSCGCGIYETRLRYETSPWALRLGTLSRLTEAEFYAYAGRITGEYLPGRLTTLGITAPEQWRALLREEGIVKNAWQDLQDMLSRIRIYEDWAATASAYPSLVFEAGQGLALDEFNVADHPHLTPSRTTSLVSAQRIAALHQNVQTQIRYVSRTYLTRHGAGPFPTECPKEDIGRDLEDRTNVPNPHQQTLRYGRFDREAVLSRVKADQEAAARLLPQISTALVLTHLNETGGILTDGSEPASLADRFDQLYLSDEPCSIRKYHG